MAWALRPSIAISSASPRCARSSSADSPFNSTLSERASHRRAHSPAQPLPRRPPQGLTPVQTDARVGTAIIVNDNRRGGQVEYAHPGAGHGARGGVRRLHLRPPPMKLGAVAGALAVDRTPDAARPEALFAHAGRWLKEPPLAEQLSRLTAALRRLAPVAEGNGVKLAIENHADYRGHELASVLEAVGSPAVGAKLDTGNAFAAVEDPTAAAQALAPFVFATHVKDVRVESEPWGRRDQVPESALIPNGLLVMLEVALGEGHVDFDAVLPHLAERGPLGRDLVLTIEDKARTIEQSVAYARQRFAAFIHA